MVKDMKILAVGDIVGKTGLQKLKDVLPFIIKDKNIDFVIVNAENAADGMGLTEKMYKEILALKVGCRNIFFNLYPSTEFFISQFDLAEKKVAYEGMADLDKSFYI